MNDNTFRGEDLAFLYNNYAKRDVNDCIVCGNVDSLLWAETGPYKAYKCAICGLVFINPQLGEEGLTYYYSNYIGKRRLSNTEKMELRSKQYILDAGLIKKFVKHGTILDVGCNGGFFLDVLGDGYERYGTELDPVAVEYAKKHFKKGGENIVQGSLHSAEYDGEMFDLVIMRGVIEHLLDPQAGIKEISRILKKSGYFYICATPNGACFCADLYRENWTLFHPVQHLWYFSSANLSIICERCGLKLVWKEYPYLNTPYESVREDTKLVEKEINEKTGMISPAFFENMMSLVFQKVR